MNRMMTFASHILSLIAGESLINHVGIHSTGHEDVFAKVFVLMVDLFVERVVCKPGDGEGREGVALGTRGPAF